ncbi:NAD-dependent epimerase/dehydratase family protein [Chitinimonas sp. PSY-7]|uniref:NAD-dependent epimerase/dehydratase family protein n=1 Tax=Chitinimonas sp. PSY-7 TaxID=3459088 RepID=UPI00403FD211
MEFLRIWKHIGHYNDAMQRRLLIIGCGDVLERALPWLTRRFRVYTLCRSRERAAALRAKGVVPIQADLDNPSSLARLAGLADYVLHSAPPSPQSKDDPRTSRLLAALTRCTILPRRLVYISTTGVYGDCSGIRFNECRPCHPESDRAHRRVVAESVLRNYGRRSGCRISILRAPGIYAANRLPLQRIEKSTPVLVPSDDNYSNHIHANDLAMACCLALFRGLPGRVYHACDDSEWKMGDWFDKVADAYKLPRPPRLPYAQIQQTASPALWSFMRESRRLDNTRLKRELGMRLAYPTPDTLLDQLRKS